MDAERGYGGARELAPPVTLLWRRHGRLLLVTTRAQKALLTTPPSTRSAAPVVADASGLATYATIDATSSGIAKRFSNDVGRTSVKNVFSYSANDLPSVFASASTKSPTPRDRVGPGSTLFTVMPVPATAS